jgi:hypothetical protein
MSIKPKHPRKQLVAIGVAACLLSLTVYAEKKPEERKAYFGETHLHTSWSMDVYAMGNTINGPEEAYQFAQGKKIKHPLGYDIQITTPLDFIGITDHGEYVGVMNDANTPGTAISKMPDAQSLILKDDSFAERTRATLAVFGLWDKPPSKQLNDPEVASAVWQKNIALADKYYQPGKFTTLHSYEYTSNIQNRNMHRNIFIRPGDKTIDRPFTMLDSPNPENLWKWMDAQRENGVDILAISHNANFSDGWMYPTDVDSLGRPIDAAWAASRMRNERLVEIKQTKGSSETHPLLSPNDEFANYELVTLGMIGQPEGDGRIPGVVGSYARQALKDGLAMQDTQGYNPYKFGFVAAADSHNGAAPYRQKNYFGDLAANNGTDKKRLINSNMAGFDARWFNPAGRTGVWAEENTREAIYDALHRKETYGVSGPNIKLRFFGGWGFEPDLLTAKSWVKTAYAEGVPMGADLPAAQSKDKAPGFIISAVKDATSGNLDRVQIIKGWTRHGQSYEKIYDVVWAGDRTPDTTTGKVPAIRSTVDLDKATFTNEVGAVELKTIWSDPDFDPAQHAFYYARVLEIPTPRWSTLQAQRLGVSRPGVVPAVVQERAWSSPIWYSPDEAASNSADPGLKMSDMKAKGAVALGDDALKEFIVGKAYFLKNTASGKSFKVRYDADMTTIVMHVNRDEVVPSLTGNLAMNGYLGNATPYSIVDGKIMTTLGGKKIGVTVYKKGDKYYAARSNEFGFVNYEFLISPPTGFSTMRE